MQTEHKESGQPGAVVICPNCHAELVAGLRFCRRCGFRLGEGVEEYTATRLFDQQAPPFAPPNAAQKEAPPFAPAGAWTAAPIAPMAPMAPLVTARPADAAWRWTNLLKPWRMGWVGWVVLSLVFMVVVGSLVNDRGRGSGPGGGPPPVQRSFLGVDGIETADGGGAMIEGIAGPDTPVVRAGLIGGDVIKSFDGKPIEDADDLRRLLRSTPRAGPSRSSTYATARRGRGRSRPAPSATAAAPTPSSGGPAAAASSASACARSNACRCRA